MRWVVDLYFNQRAAFTRWAVSTGALHEGFVVVDVGVLGGENPRWHLLGDHLVIYGFDASEAAVSDLIRKNPGAPGKHYFPIALGNEDGERTFYFNTDNPSSSSFYSQGSSGRSGDEERRVQIRRLDTLLSDGTIPHPDFIKIDVEGFELAVLDGAHKTMTHLLGAEVETSFNISSIYPEGHSVMMQQRLLRSRLLVFDLNFNRVPRSSYQLAMNLRPREIVGEMGRPATVNALFCRDITNEIDHPEDYREPRSPLTTDQIIKMMMIYELHGLNDIAYDVATRLKPALGARFDVEKALALLVDPLCQRIIDNSLRQTMAMKWMSFRRKRLMS